MMGRLLIGGATLLGVGISYAYTMLTVGSGYLLTSVLSMMPGWRLVDPLPVLDYANDDDEEDEDESLASMVERNQHDNSDNN